MADYVITGDIVPAGPGQTISSLFEGIGDSSSSSVPLGQLPDVLQHLARDASVTTETATTGYTLSSIGTLNSVSLTNFGYFLGATLAPGDNDGTLPNENTAGTAVTLTAPVAQVTTGNLPHFEANLTTHMTLALPAANNLSIIGFQITPVAGVNSLTDLIRIKDAGAATYSDLVGFDFSNGVQIATATKGTLVASSHQAQFEQFFQDHSYVFLMQLRRASSSQMELDYILRDVTAGSTLEYGGVVLAYNTVDMTSFQISGAFHEIREFVAWQSTTETTGLSRSQIVDWGEHLWGHSYLDGQVYPPSTELIDTYSLRGDLSAEGFRLTPESGPPQDLYPVPDPSTGAEGQIPTVRSGAYLLETPSAVTAPSGELTRVELATNLVILIAATDRTWTDYSTLFTKTITSDETGVNFFEYDVHASTTAVPGGGGRVYVEYRIQRTRGSVTTILGRTTDYLRNFDDSSARIDQLRYNEIVAADDNETGDIVTLSVRVNGQVARTAANENVTWIAGATNRFVFARPGGADGPAGSPGAPGAPGTSYNFHTANLSSNVTVAIPTALDLWSAGSEIFRHTVTSAQAGVGRVNAVLNVVTDTALADTATVVLDYSINRTRSSVETTIGAEQRRIYPVGSSVDYDEFTLSADDNFETGDIITVTVRALQAGTLDATPGNLTYSSGAFNRFQLIYPTLATTQQQVGQQVTATGQIAEKSITEREVSDRLLADFSGLSVIRSTSPFGDVQWAFGTVHSGLGTMTNDVQHVPTGLTTASPTSSLPLIYNRADDTDVTTFEEYTRAISLPLDQDASNGIVPDPLPHQAGLVTGIEPLEDAGDGLVLFFTVRPAILDRDRVLFEFGSVRGVLTSAGIVRVYDGATSIATSSPAGAAVANVPEKVIFMIRRDVAANSYTCEATHSGAVGVVSSSTRVIAGLSAETSLTLFNRTTPSSVDQFTGQVFDCYGVRFTRTTQTILQAWANAPLTEDREHPYTAGGVIVSLETTGNGYSFQPGPDVLNGNTVAIPSSLQPAVFVPIVTNLDRLFAIEFDFRVGGTEPSAWMRVVMPAEFIGRRTTVADQATIDDNTCIMAHFAAGILQVGQGPRFYFNQWDRYGFNWLVNDATSSGLAIFQYGNNTLPSPEIRRLRLVPREL